MPYAAGPELDIRTALACGWPLDHTNYVADSAVPEMTSTLAWGPPEHWWMRLLRYWLDIPSPWPDTRYCGIVPPPFSKSFTDCQTAAGMMSHTLTSTTALDAANELVALWEGQQAT